MTSIYIFDQNPQTFIDLVRKRPNWQIIPINIDLNITKIEPNSWVFLNWIFDGDTSLYMSRKLRQLDDSATLNLNAVLSLEEIDLHAARLTAIGFDVIRSPLDAKKIINKVESVAGFEILDPINFKLGSILVDVQAHLVLIGDKPVSFSKTEFKMLVYFFQNQGRLISRAEFLLALGKEKGEMKERSVDMWVNRVRRLVSSNGGYLPIRVVRHRGYVLDKE